jgi:hypothetical protein
MAREALLPIPVARLEALSPTQISTVSEECERLLLEGTRVPIESTRQWAARFPAEAGVYAIFDNDGLVYIGETGSIRGRMTDLCDTRNHTLRRNIGEEYFSGCDGYERATSKRCFPAHIEVMVTRFISKMYLTAAIVPFGRSEIEEAICEKHATCFNRKGKRGTGGLNRKKKSG